MNICFKNKLEKNIFVLLICLIFSGLIGILFIQIPDFDFYSYHFHAGWSFLNNRIGIDFMPCQARSYFNPLLDMINYFCIEKMNNHPYIYLFVSNLKYGLFLFLSYLIADFIFKESKIKNLCIKSTIFMVILSPIVNFSMRIDSNDIQVANFILISFYIFIKYIFQDSSNRKIWALFLSALFLGMGVGLKYSIIVFVIPLMLCTFIYLKKDSVFIKTIFLMLLGGILGLIISDGWWLYMLWSHFQNPFFPYFNNIFKSPMADSDAILISEYSHLMPTSFFDYIFAPLKNTISAKFIGLEHPYYEPKMVLTFFAVIFSLYINKLPAIKEKLESIIVDTRIFTISIICIVIVYYGNAAMYGTLRYIIALAVISSYIIVALSLLCCKKFRGKTQYPLLVFILLWSCLAYYYETNKVVVNNFITKIMFFEKTKIEDNSLILCGNQTACFIAPSINKNVKYIAFTIPASVSEKESLWFNEESLYKNYYYHSDYLEEKVKKEIEKNNNVYIIFYPYGFKQDVKVYLKSLDYYSNGKIKNLDRCRAVRFSILSMSDKTYLCKLK